MAQGFQWVLISMIFGASFLPEYPPLAFGGRSVMYRSHPIEISDLDFSLSKIIENIFLDDRNMSKFVGR